MTSLRRGEAAGIRASLIAVGAAAERMLRLRARIKGSERRGEIGRRERLQDPWPRRRGGFESASPPTGRDRRESGGTGRRAGLRIRWPEGHGGSTPAFRTTRLRPREAATLVAELSERDADDRDDLDSARTVQD